MRPAGRGLPVGALAAGLLLVSAADSQPDEVLSRSLTIQNVGLAAPDSARALSRAATLQNLWSTAPDSARALSRATTAQNLGPPGDTPGPAVSRAFTVYKEATPVDVPHDAAEIPALTFVLHSARPNPARSSALIEYELAEARPVRLEVIDVSGRRSRLIVASARQEPGRHVAAWDGRDDRGRELPSGVYFLRLRAGRFDQTRRVVLLRD